MAILPEDIENWDIGLLTNLVHEGYDENEILEFKSDLSSDNDKIAKTVCAFANTRGGTIVFGLNNNREKTNLDEILCGLNDGDDLKQKIQNVLQNIRPNIPINDIIFKKTNIKLINGKVIVILKILPSDLAPHQFEHKFYKRVSNGNEPMTVDEVRSMVLDSQKNKFLTGLLEQECGHIRRMLKEVLDLLKNKDTISALFYCEGIDCSITKHFLFHQSFTYPQEIQQKIFRIVESVEKMNKLSTTTAKDYLKKRDFNALVHDLIKEDVNFILPIIDQVEKDLKLHFIEPTSISKLKKDMKKDNIKSK